MKWYLIYLYKIIFRQNQTILLLFVENQQFQTAHISLFTELKNSKVLRVLLHFVHSVSLSSCSGKVKKNSYQFYTRVDWKHFSGFVVLWQPHCGWWAHVGLTFHPHSLMVIDSPCIAIRFISHVTPVNQTQVALGLVKARTITCTISFQFLLFWYNNNKKAKLC